MYSLGLLLVDELMMHGTNYTNFGDHVLMVICNVIISHQHLSLIKCDYTKLTTEMYKDLTLHFQHVGGHVNILNMEDFHATHPT